MSDLARTLVLRYRAHLALFALSLAVFAAIAGDRLRRASPDPHFALQATAWLNGRLDIPSYPAGADDPAKVEEVKLDDGSVRRGRRIPRLKIFRAYGGEELPLTRVKETVRTLLFVSFPPFPAVLMLPQAKIHGERANDVAFTVILAAFVPPIFLLVLGRLRHEGHSPRTPGEDVWITLALTFGTVFFFCAVQGRVWYTAHIVGVLLATIYAWAAIGAARPLAAGVALALAFVTRTPMLFMAPLFLFEAWRTSGGVGALTVPGPERRRLVRRVLTFGTPILVVGLLAAWHNHARFGEWAEFGHNYLAVRQQAQIEVHGLLSPFYLARNLAVAFTLLPTILPKSPWLSISGHGLAIWFTSPFLVLLLWPRAKGPLHRPLWITVACVAAFSLAYQNSGWVQFGYRFLLDYAVFLLMLLAIGGRPLTRPTKALIVIAIAVNLFGAITFNRANKLYRFDNATYSTVVAH